MNADVLRMYKFALDSELYLEQNDNQIVLRNINGGYCLCWLVEANNLAAEF